MYPKIPDCINGAHAIDHWQQFYASSHFCLEYTEAARRAHAAPPNTIAGKGSSSHGLGGGSGGGSSTTNLATSATGDGGGGPEGGGRGAASSSSSAAALEVGAGGAGTGHGGGDVSRLRSIRAVFCGRVLLRLARFLCGCIPAVRRR